MTRLSITCVMTAFNYERYVTGALDSVLAQEYPADLLDVVVIDDGSTDGTAAAVDAVATRAGGRVTLVRQANAGLAAATQTAIEQATGELIAICDADDEWLPGKVRDQVAILAARDEVTLVYGDMQVIDSDGALVDRSYFTRERVTPRRGDVLADLLAMNFTTNSTLMFRAEHVRPIPDSSPYADYWLAVHAAAAGAVEVIERPLASYRLHDGNMSFGASGMQRARELRRELDIRRLLLTSDLYRTVPVAALAQAVRDLEDKARGIVAAAGTPLVEIVRVTDADRELAERELERADTHGDPEARVRSCARACLLNPLDPRARERLETLLRADSTAGITVARADELLAHPELLGWYCARAAGEPASVLLIVAPTTGLEAVAGRLRGSLAAVGIDPDDCPDLRLVAEGQHESLPRPVAALTRQDELAGFAGVPPLRA